MKKLIAILLALVLTLALAAGALAEEITYTSRGVEVPATVTMPKSIPSGGCPFVVMAHGHGGERTENGGFTAIADALAEKGIATIRMDFSGCGASTESFKENNLTNMKADVLAAIDYMQKNYKVDDDMGIFGYSMGGRIALELIGEGNEFDAVVLLAPAADNEDLKKLFGGAEAWEEMKADAKANGFHTYTTIYGQVQDLGEKWFTDIEANTDVIAKAAAKIGDDGEDVRVIYALNDEAVSPAVSQSVADALHASVVNTTEDGHGYGFYSDNTAVLNAVVSSVSDFFAKELD